MTTEHTREHVDSPDDPLLVLHVDHTGAASLTVRDDVDLSAAVAWLREAVAHIRELHGQRPPVAPPLSSRPADESDLPLPEC